MAMQLLADQSIGFLGIKLCYPEGDRIQHGGIRVGELLYGSGYNEVKHDLHAHEFVDAERISMAVTFACAMTRRQTLEKLGGLDELYLPNGYGDVDTCMRALDAGYRNYYLGSLSGIHHESISRGVTNEDLEISFLHQRNGSSFATCAHWHLDRSYRYAWPLILLRINDPGHAAGPRPGATGANHPASNALTSALPNCRQAQWDAKVRLPPGAWDRSFRSLAGSLGSEPGATNRAMVRVGRRVLGPIPVVGSVARKGVRQLRKAKQGLRTSVTLAKTLYRNPDAAWLLPMGLRQGGCARSAPVTSDARSGHQVWPSQSPGVV